MHSEPAPVRETVSAAAGASESKLMLDVDGAAVPHGNAVKKPRDPGEMVIKLATTARTSAGMPGMAWMGSSSVCPAPMRPA